MSSPSSSLGLYISDSFAEISSANEISSTSKIAPKKWYLRSKSLVDGLKEFLDENKIVEGCRLHVSSFWPEMVFQKNLGNPPALLVSAGFEDWLHLRQPKKTWLASLPPERYRSFFSADYI